MLLSCNCEEQIGRLVRAGQPDMCVPCCTLAVVLLPWIDGCIAVPVTISVELRDRVEAPALHLHDMCSVHSIKHTEIV